MNRIATALLALFALSAPALAADAMPGPSPAPNAMQHHTAMKGHDAMKHGAANGHDAMSRHSAMSGHDAMKGRGTTPAPKPTP